MQTPAPDLEISVARQKWALGFVLVVGIADLLVLDAVAFPRWLEARAATEAPTTPEPPAPAEPREPVALASAQVEPSPSLAEPPVPAGAPSAPAEPVGAEAAPEPASVASAEPVAPEPRTPLAPEPVEPAVGALPVEPATPASVATSPAPSGPSTSTNVVPEPAEPPELPPLRFRTGAARLTEESMETLEAVAFELATRRKLKAELRGHSDARGDPNDNLALSRERADAAARYLIEWGIETERLVLRGVGESDPLDTGSTPEAWAKNRRVEIIWITGATK